MWCGFSAQVTTAIIFNLKVFNKSFKKALTAQKIVEATLLQCQNWNIKLQNHQVFSLNTKHKPQPLCSQRLSLSGSCITEMVGWKLNETKPNWIIKEAQRSRQIWSPSGRILKSNSSTVKVLSSYRKPNQFGPCGAGKRKQTSKAIVCKTSLWLNEYKPLGGPGEEIYSDLLWLWRWIHFTSKSDWIWFKSEDYAHNCTRLCNCSPKCFCLSTQFASSITPTQRLKSYLFPRLLPVMDGLGSFYRWFQDVAHLGADVCKDGCVKEKLKRARVDNHEKITLLQDETLSHLSPHTLQLFRYLTIFFGIPFIFFPFVFLLCVAIHTNTHTWNSVVFMLP